MVFCLTLNWVKSFRLMTGLCTLQLVDGRQWFVRVEILKTASTHSQHPQVISITSYSPHAGACDCKALKLVLA